MIASLKEWVFAQPLLLPALWAATVPWLLFPTIAPLLTAVSILLLLFLLLTTPSTPRFTLTPTPINSYLLILLMLTGIAYIVSPLPQISLPKLTVTLLGAVTFFLLLPRFKTLEGITQIITLLALCTGLIIAAGFFTLEFPARQIINLKPITDRLPHLSGSFTINYNEMAGTLLMLLPFVLTAFRKANGRPKKLVFLLILISLCILLLFTQSRSGFLGIGVIGLSWHFWGRIPLKKLSALLIITALILLLVFFLMDFSTNDLSNWLTTLDASSKQGNVAPTSWLTRLDIWHKAVQMLADYGAIGAGLYTFDPISRANYIYETILPGFNLTHAHNLLLQTGASLGISGMLAMAALWATVLAKLWRASQSADKQTQRLSAVFAASISGYLFFNLFDTITFGQKPGFFIWIILAGAIGLSQMTRGQISDKQPMPQKLVAFTPLLVLIILLLSPMLPRNLSNIKLDKAYLQSQANPPLDTADYSRDVRRTGLALYLLGQEQDALARWQTDPEGANYLRSQGTIALIAGDIGQATRWYDLSLELAPETAETYFWRGVANEERGTLTMAEADFRRAIEYSAISEIDEATTAVYYYRLGLILAGEGKWEEAANAYNQAATLQPDINFYFLALGDALTVLGDQTGAEAAYNKAKAE